MLQIGQAAIDITPPLGTHLAGSGMGEHRPAQKILDPLYAKVMVAQAKDAKLCIITLDTLAVTLPYTRAIRESAVALGFEPHAVMVHSLQNHSAPSCGALMLDPDFPLDLRPDQEHITGSEAAYTKQAVAGATRAIQEANDALTPVQVAMGHAVRDDLAFNRRGVMRGGNICMPWPFTSDAKPLGPTDIVYMEGPADPQVGVWCAQSAAGDVAAMLLHFTCHPVNVFAREKNTVCADWPGAWSAKVKDQNSLMCPPMVINGCCGNVNPWPAFTPNFTPDHVRMGNELADTTQAVIESLSFADVDSIDWHFDKIPLAYRDIPNDRQDQVNRILAEHPTLKLQDNGEVDPTWFHAASTKSIELCRNREPQFMYEIQVCRIGDMAIISLPGEPFVEGQLEIKTRSPAKLTFIAHMSTQYVGYLPTSDACARPGHETNANCTYWAKFAPDSLERIVKATLAILTELFENN